MILEIPHTKLSLECQTTYLDSKEEMLHKAINLLKSKLSEKRIIEIFLKKESHNEVYCFGKGEIYLWNPISQSLTQKYPSLF